MMPPQPRRASYARRSQYGAFAVYVVATIAVVGGLLSALIWSVDPVGFASLRLAVAEIVAPVGRVTGSGANSIGQIDDEVAAYWRAGSQNARLTRELVAARRELIVARGLRNENRRLRALLNLRNDADALVATVRLLSSTASSARRFAIIDGGTRVGIRPRQPVRSADGLIGRTLDVGATVSRILLLTDGQSVVPVRRGSDGLAAQAMGRGDALLEIRTLNSATNPWRVGDVLLTSGSGGLYQPGTPVALIIRLTADGALARPIADAATTDAVIVERAADAGLSLPPPRPEGSGSPPAGAAQ
jgi:rod shape-determining protein MreC